MGQRCFQQPTRFGQRRVEQQGGAEACSAANKLQRRVQQPIRVGQRRVQQPTTVGQRHVQQPIGVGQRRVQKPIRLGIGVFRNQ